MYKVFLVEDESIIREGLRDNIPWEQYGFTFAGEAGDGEIALPLIRKERPDVLITDIRMPFMDGLSLCRVVKSEMPDIRIVILSGYDDFEYARNAIEVGVEKYLTKPVTRRAMTQALQELSGKLDREKQKEEYVFRRREEMHEYEQFLRRRFFEEIFAGSCTVEDIYREAGRLGLQMDGPAYCVMLVDIFSDAGGEDAKLLRCREDVCRFFLRHPQYLLTSWVNHAMLVVVRGERNIVEEYVSHARKRVAELMADYGEGPDYLLCISRITERISHLKECYEQVRVFFTCRYMSVDEKVITEENYEDLPGRDDREEAGTGQETDVPADRTAAEDDGDSRDAGGTDTMQNVLAYIDEHYTDEDLSLNTIAAIASVSPGYFSSMFSQRMGMTFIEYVTGRRIERAKELLVTTGKSTSQIAALAGYRDPNYFRSVFKKQTGHTPREYRTVHSA